MTRLVDLLKDQNVASVEVTDYDFKTQTRIDSPAMYSTWGTAQTFNSQGTPVDQRADED
jgi:hypothetical protein